jgi:hypothetical protein
METRSQPPMSNDRLGCLLKLAAIGEPVIISNVDEISARSSSGIGRAPK